MEKRENRDKNNVCRFWLQIESCRKCLFDALCLYLDNNNKNARKWETDD